MQIVDFASYGDDNTIYNAGDNIDGIICSLQESSKKLLKWFADKANKKLRALAKVTTYMTLEKKKIVMNSFFNAQSNLALITSLPFVLHSRKKNQTST